MKTIEVSEVDFKRAGLVLQALNKAKHELEGSEVLALAQGMRWLAEIQMKIDLAMKAPAPEQPAVPEKIEEPKPEKKSKKG